MKRSGTADLPLHYLHVPLWLADRMSKFGFAIIETIALEFSTSKVITKLSNPANRSLLISINDKSKFIIEKELVLTK